MITTVNSSRLSEMLISQMIETRRFDQHLRRLGRQLSDARILCVEKFQEMGLEIHTDNPTGFYTMLSLPSHASMESLQSHAARHRVFVAPGQWFSPREEQETTSMRINFTRSADQRFFSFLENFLSNKT